MANFREERGQGNIKTSPKENKLLSLLKETYGEDFIERIVNNFYIFLKFLNIHLLFLK